MGDNVHYAELYALQDDVLLAMRTYEEFYLTGGTALHRAYAGMRYSDDLDFFAKAFLDDFPGRVRKIVRDLAEVTGYAVAVEASFERFVRLTVSRGKQALQVDLVNEDTAHWGGYAELPLFSRVDNEMNILANKLTALSRHEAKDVCDIIVLARRQRFSWTEVFAQACLKEPIDVLATAELLSSFPEAAFAPIKWIGVPDTSEMMRDLAVVVREMIAGSENSVCGGGHA